MTKIAFIFIFLLTSLIAYSQEKTSKEKIEEKSKKIIEKKQKADSLLQKAGLSTPNVGVGGSVIGKSSKEAVNFFTETLPDLGLKIKEIKKAEKVRREKKKKFHSEYEGISIVRMTTKLGSGDRLTEIEFHVLKENRPPHAYDGIDIINWYDTRNRILSKSAIKDKESALILHGPYKRYVAGNLVEEGNYYIGARDGRWETYDADFKLLDKSKWSRGFPAESIITYYDSAHTKLKEVIPIQYGKRKGDYLKYYDGGQLMVKGQYDNDMPIGTWTEYYQYKRQRKKITRYPARWYDDGEGVVLNEWDDKGKLIYELPKDKQKTEEVEN